MKPQATTAGLIGILLICSEATGASLREEDGRRAYQAHCASCHETGVDDAPSIQKPKDWTQRSNLWESVLFEHANKGYLDMPAKGGKKQASEYEVNAAAEYMLNLSHPGLPQD